MTLHNKVCCIRPNTILNSLDEKLKAIEIAIQLQREIN